jgi:small basic protein
MLTPAIGIDSRAEPHIRAFVFDDDRLALIIKELGLGIWRARIFLAGIRLDHVRIQVHRELLEPSGEVAHGSSSRSGLGMKLHKELYARIIALARKIFATTALALRLKCGRLTAP